MPKRPSWTLSGGHLGLLPMFNCCALASLATSFKPHRKKGPGQQFDLKDEPIKANKSTWLT
jgi:hypothetical protein